MDDWEEPRGSKLSREQADYELSRRAVDKLTKADPAYQQVARSSTWGQRREILHAAAIGAGLLGITEIVGEGEHEREVVIIPPTIRWRAEALRMEGIDERVRSMDNRSLVLMQAAGLKPGPDKEPEQQEYGPDYDQEDF